MLTPVNVFTLVLRRPMKTHWAESKRKMAVSPLWTISRCVPLFLKGGLCTVFREVEILFVQRMSVQLQLDTCTRENKHLVDKAADLEARLAVATDERDTYVLYFSDTGCFVLHFPDTECFVLHFPGTEFFGYVFQTRFYVHFLRLYRSLCLARCLE